MTVWNPGVLVRSRERIFREDGQLGQLSEGLTVICSPLLVVSCSLLVVPHEQTGQFPVAPDASGVTPAGEEFDPKK